MKNYGLIIEPIVPGEHYILGSEESLKGDAVLQPDGQWDDYLPDDDEFQTLDDRDPQACVSFGTTNAIEILIKRVYGKKKNYSDRWLAKATATDTKGGNDPHYVAEFLRKSGAIEEAVWPLKGIRTFADFYANFPTNLYQLALAFVSEFTFGHEWVPTYQLNIKEAQACLMAGLTYSTLGVSVHAWVRREDGTYYKPSTAHGDNHWVVCYGYVEGKYWKIYDSYDHSRKKYAWDSIFGIAKRYTLTRQIANESAFSVFLKWLRALVFGPSDGLPASQEPTVPSTAPPAPLKPKSVELYEEAKRWLGMDASPSDIASDEVGCAESVCTILRRIYPDFPILVSTIRLEAHLRKDPRFKLTTQAKEGVIIISPTVSTNIGHVGIFGPNQRIMSNTSATGKWQSNYTLDSWVAYFRTKKALRIFYFEPI